MTKINKDLINYLKDLVKEMIFYKGQLLKSFEENTRLDQE